LELAKLVVAIALRVCSCLGPKKETHIQGDWLGPLRIGHIQKEPCVKKDSNDNNSSDEDKDNNNNNNNNNKKKT